MALKLTPKQSQAFVGFMNEEFKKDSKGAKIEQADFKDATWTVDEVKAWLKSASIPAKDEDGESTDVSTGEDPMVIWEGLAKAMEPERFQKVVASFVRKDVSTKKDKAAFKIIEGPAEKELTLNRYFWTHNEAEENGPFNEEFFKANKVTDSTPDASDILKKMAASDRASLIKKLDFPAEWKQYSDKSGWALFAKTPVKKHYLNFTFQARKFLQGAAKMMKRSGVTTNQDELVEKLADVLNKIGKKENAYYSSEDYAMGGDNASYAEDDAKSRELSQIKDDMDGTIQDYIDKLVALDVDEADIKKALLEGAQEVYNEGYRRVENSVGSYYLSSEEQLDFNYHDYEEEMDPSLPYPTNLQDNIALLTEESANQLKKQVDELALRISWDDAKDAYQLDDCYLHLGDDRSVHLIADEAEFISKAKRMIKDAKLAKRGTAASLDGYPALSALVTETIDSVRFPLLAALRKISS